MQTLISAAKTSSFIKDNCEKGFSLVEILVAMTLVAVVFAIAPYSSSSAKLEDAVEKFERAIKAAANEAILKNTVSRININFEPESDDEDVTVTYSVEYGPDGGMALPEVQDIQKMGLRDKEKYQEEVQKIDSKFSALDDYENVTLPFDVYMPAVIMGEEAQIISEGQVAVYFYPTGERDDAMVFLNSYEEFASIRINAFTERPIIDFVSFQTSELDNLEDSVDNRVRGAQSEWNQL